MISWQIKLVSAAAFLGTHVNGAVTSKESQSSDSDWSSSSVALDRQLLRQWPTTTHEPSEEKRNFTDNPIQHPTGNNRLIQQVLNGRQVTQHEKVGGKSRVYETYLPETTINDINGFLGHFGVGLNGVTRVCEFETLSINQKIEYINQYMIRVTEAEWYGSLEKQQFKCLKDDNENLTFFRNDSKSTKPERIRWKTVEISEILERMLTQEPIRDDRRTHINRSSKQTWSHKARKYLRKTVHKYPVEFAVWMWNRDPTDLVYFSPDTDINQYLFDWVVNIKERKMCFDKRSQK